MQTRETQKSSLTHQLVIASWPPHDFVTSTANVVENGIRGLGLEGGRSLTWYFVRELDPFDVNKAVVHNAGNGHGQGQCRLVLND